MRSGHFEWKEDGARGVRGVLERLAKLTEEEFKSIGGSEKRSFLVETTQYMFHSMAHGKFQELDILWKAFSVFESHQFSQVATEAVTLRFIATVRNWASLIHVYSTIPNDIKSVASLMGKQSKKRRILLFDILYKNDRRHSFLELRKLADEKGMSPWILRNVLRELEKLGLVRSAFFTNKKYNFYEITWDGRRIASQFFEIETETEKTNI